MLHPLGCVLLLLRLLRVHQPISAMTRLLLLGREWPSAPTHSFTVTTAVGCNTVVLGLAFLDDDASAMMAGGCMAILFAFVSVRATYSSSLSILYVPGTALRVRTPHADAFMCDLHWILSFFGAESHVLVTFISRTTCTCRYCFYSEFYELKC